MYLLKSGVAKNIQNNHFIDVSFFYFILPTSYYKRNPLPFLFLLLIPNLLYVPCFWLLKHIMFIATVRSAVLALLYHCYHISSCVLVDDKLCYILSLC
jgi:hypothetical protein